MKTLRARLSHTLKLALTCERSNESNDFLPEETEMKTLRARLLHTLKLALTCARLFVRFPAMGGIGTPASADILAHARVYVSTLVRLSSQI